MSAFFLFNNIHVAQELLGALVFAVAAWLALDAFLIRRDFLTASRGIGFIVLSIAQVLHAFGLFGASHAASAHVIYILGAAFVLLNLLLERPVDRPKLHAMAPMMVVVTYGHYLVAFLYAAIAFFSYLQYRKETKKNLAPFWLAFTFLFLASLCAAFYAPGELSVAWVVGHLLETAGFISLGFWVWQYLSARLEEEIVLIFTSLAMSIAIVVTLAFSTILIHQVENATKENLAANVKVLDFAVLSLKDEALAKARALSVDEPVLRAYAQNDFAALQDRAVVLFEEEKIGFLTFVDRDGRVIVRAHALTRRDDTLALEAAAGSALRGKAQSAIEVSSFEKLSVRAAAPVYLKGEIAGAVVLGYPLDVAFADKLKRVTGLDVSIIQGDTIIASTIGTNRDRTPLTDITITDREVLTRVRGSKESITLSTRIAGAPYLASYSPLADQEGAVIGMISVAKSQSDIAGIAARTNILTLITVIAIVLVLIIPLYLVTKRLAR